MDYTNPNDFWSRNDPELYKDYSDDERTARTICAVMIRMLAIFVLLCVIEMCSSCTTTKYVPIVEHHTDTLRVTQYQRDSVYVHDSIEIRITGDTVRIDRWHTAWRDRIVRDTVYQSKRDSIPYPVEVIKEVPAELTWWQQTRLHLANILLWLLALLAVIYVGKKHLARLNH